MYASQSICQITLILFALVAGIYLSIGLLFIQFILHMFIISCFDTHYDSNGILFNTFQNRQKSNAKKTHTQNKQKQTTRLIVALLIMVNPCKNVFASWIGIK